MFLIIIAVIIVVAWAYAFFLREWMVAKWPEQIGWWHLLEDKLWERSRTLFFARLYWVGGLVILIHDGLAQSGVVDWTPLIGEIAKFLPEKYRPLTVALWPVATGILFEVLRRITTQPLQELKREQ